jgi:probable phosphoglycerate mutase
MLKSGITLYFVRHGETDWNARQRYQGRQDIPLNARGREQAARNGRALAELLGARTDGLDYVASPLMRAFETMQIVRTAMGLPRDAFRTDDRLSEVHYGHWEGRYWAELPSTDPEGFAARKADTWGWQPTGGESYRMLSERVAGWLAEVQHDSIVASHGGVSRVLRGLVLGLEPARIPVLEVPQDKVLIIRDGTTAWL